MTMVKILWFMTIIMIHSHELPPQRTIIILLRVKVCLFWGVAASDKPQQFLIIVKDGSLRGKIPISKWVNNHSRAQVFIYIYIYNYIHMHMSIYTYVYIYIYIYMCVCVCVGYMRSINRTSPQLFWWLCGSIGPWHHHFYGWFMTWPTWLS